MFMYRLLRRKEGVSYIQILLASSVIAGLAVVGLKMMENQEKLARLTSQKFETSYLLNEMIHILKDPVNCKATFQGMNPSNSVRKINSLKKELRGGKHKESTYYLKYSTFNSSKKYYGQNNIKIESYTLTDEGDDVDVNRGSTNLVVSFVLDEEEKQAPKKLLKSIPLRIKSRGEKLESCVYFNNSASIETTSTLKSRVLGKTLAIGKDSHDVELSLDGGVTLVPLSGDFPSCDKSSVGTLIYSKRHDDLYYCNPYGGWSTLGVIPSNPSHSFSYKLDPLNNNIVSQVTKRHRLCLVQEFKSNVKGSCLIQPLEKTNFRNFKITANFDSPQGGQYCKVECFN